MMNSDRASRARGAGGAKPQRERGGRNFDRIYPAMRGTGTITGIGREERSEVGGAGECKTGSEKLEILKSGKWEFGEAD